MIIDLDGTLVYACEVALDRQAELRFRGLHLYLRPFYDVLIERCFQHFSVAVWTSAGHEYASFVVGQLFGARARQLDFLWSRRHCRQWYDLSADRWVHQKPLAAVTRGGRPLDRIIVIDDTPSLVIPADNVIALPEYRGDLNDQALRRLVERWTGVPAASRRHP